MGYPHEVTFKVKLAIIQTSDFHTKKEHTNRSYFIKFVIYMCYHILFEGIYYVISYYTHIWNAYISEIFLEIINSKNEPSL